jgi:diadenosine tetraphosphate (Ap4A) HIT family hydrolase
VTGFVLDPRLAADTIELGRLALSRLLLMDEARYPWLILVPMRAGLRELFELPAPERAQLMEEAAGCGRVLAAAGSDGRPADKINIAALGNVVTQLHVHVIARFIGDAAWPAPVWGRHPPEPYHPAERDALVARLLPGLAAEPIGFRAAGAPTA